MERALTEGYDDAVIVYKNGDIASNTTTEVEIKIVSDKKETRDALKRMKKIDHRMFIIKYIPSLVKRSEKYESYELTGVGIIKTFNIDFYSVEIIKKEK
jgi:hypothetical protein